VRNLLPSSLSCKENPNESRQSRETRRTLSVRQRGGLERCVLWKAILARQRISFLGIDVTFARFLSCSSLSFSFASELVSIRWKFPRVIRERERWRVTPVSNGSAQCLTRCRDEIQCAMRDARCAIPAIIMELRSKTFHLKYFVGRRSNAVLTPF